MPHRSTIITAILFAAAACLPARILNVPAAFRSIQTAVDSTSPGDTVLVHPGIYVENINYNGHNVVVGSLFLTTGDIGYIDSTIIDGDSSGSVVRFDSGETAAAMLAGFTVRNGSGSIDAENDVSGGGVHATGASPRLTHLKVEGNTAWYAAGIYCELGADALISHCTIAGNVAAIAGGGIDAYDADPTIVNCTISGNRALRGGGIYVYFDAELTIENSVIWGNQPQEILFSISGEPCSVGLSYSTLKFGRGGVVTNGNGTAIWGNGNIEFDPLFEAPVDGDYRLTALSPCIDAANPQGELDPDRTWADMGSLYHPHERRDEPRILLSAPALEMGIVEVGRDTSLNCFARNVGYADLAIASIEAAGENADEFAVDFQGEFALAPGAQYLMEVVFSPRSDGFKHAELIITSDDPNRRQSMTSLSGRGVARRNRRLWNVPDDFARVQDAVQFAAGGDTILVDPGIYRENIDFLGKEIMLSSRDLFDRDYHLIASTILEGDRSGGVVNFRGGEDENSIIQGFTIRNGKDGVYVSAASPIIRRCVITGNDAVNTGGGALNCRNGARPIIDNCTVSGNTARWGGAIYCMNGSDLLLMNTILWGNAPGEIYFSSTGDANRVETLYCDVEGGEGGIDLNGNGQAVWGQGNLEADPLFLNPARGDFRLTWFNYPRPDETKSPCIDAGDPNVAADPDGSRADVGALVFDPDVNPDITADPETVEFGEVQTGTAVQRTVEIGNSGVLTLRIASQSIVIVEGPPFITITSGGGEAALESGEFHQTALTFSPWIEEEYSALLRIESNDPDQGTFDIPVIGYGLGVGEPDAELPAVLSISAVFPQPCNSSATVRFGLPHPGFHTLRLLGSDGREVSRLYSRRARAGFHTAVLNAVTIPSGCYLLELVGPAEVVSKNLAIIK